jgi:hypothetical protein
MAEKVVTERQKKEPKPQIVEQKISRVRWEMYTYTQQQVRIFYGNAVSFFNKGTGDVFINDVYLLSPGESLSLECDQNEIDATPYKLSFDLSVPGTVFRLQVAVKENQGIQEMMYAIINDPRLTAGDRRAFLKRYHKFRKRSKF